MLFNSLEFLIFLPTVFILYWVVFNKNLRNQNILLLVCSYVFYGWWDYRFLSLIFLSTLVDYFIGFYINKSNDEKKRKILLWFSVLFNLGVLGFFKYYNFFVDSWIDLFSSVGYDIQSKWTLNIILPVGISFYTFQTMSYTIDVWRKNLEPTKDFISFASFVAFFPQLVAGPIERATNLLPQILNKRTFKYEQGIQGLRLIIWGMFKKVIIADSLAPMVNDIFANYQDFGSATLWLGVLYFTFQIYCDFSGYSDMAIGISKLFGIDIMTNFNFPYFSRNIGEFWRRWHISLSTWFRDYLYIPLGGSKGGKWLSLRNIFIIFIVSGFWHGANWTFIIWGLIHAMLYVPSFIFNTNRKYIDTVVAEKSWFPSIKELLQIGTTFFFVTIAWVFFRSPGILYAVDYLTIMFSNIQSGIHYSPVSNVESYKYLIYVALLLVMDYAKYKNLYKNRVIITIEMLVTTLLILVMFQGVKSDFIYFQF